MGVLVYSQVLDKVLVIVRTNIWIRVSTRPGPRPSVGVGI